MCHSRIARVINRRWLVCACTLLVVWLSGLTPGAASDRVYFDSLDGSTRLTGLLQLPAGEPPFRAVVFLHGCSGLGRDGGISPLYSSWASHLNNAGYAVLIVNSAGSRGFGPTCGASARRRVMVRDRPKDAYGALRYLQSQPAIRPDRIALIGWSQGGGITLLSVAMPSIGRPSPPPVHDFKAAVAFYPSACSDRLQHHPYTQVARGDWKTKAPLLILHGAEDNFTKAEPCRLFIDAVRRRGQPVSIVVYSRAVHAFDAPNLRLQQRTTPLLSDGTRPWIGTDRAAREDALRRVPAFLDAHLPVD